jgi:hypothetical protein
MNDYQWASRINAARREKIEDIFPGLSWHAQHEIGFKSRQADRAYQVQPAFNFVHHALRMFMARR